MIQMKDKNRITTHFIPLLPQILAKVQISRSPIILDVTFFNPVLCHTAFAQWCPVYYAHISLSCIHVIFLFYFEILSLCLRWPAVLGRCGEGEPPSQSSPLLLPGDIQQHSRTGEGKRRMGNVENTTKFDLGRLLKFLPRLRVLFVMWSYTYSTLISSLPEVYCSDNNLIL